MKISKMPMTTINSDEYIIPSIDDGVTDNNKVSLDTVTDWIATDREYSALNTDSKTLLGAVSEIAGRAENNRKKIANLANKIIADRESKVVVFKDQIEDAEYNDIEFKIKPPYDNNGYDQPWLGGTHKNIFDGIFEQGDFLSGEKRDIDTRIRSSNFVKVRKETSYTFDIVMIDSLSERPQTLFMYFFDINYNYVAYTSYTLSETTKTITFPNSGIYSTLGEFYIKIAFGLPSGNTIRPNYVKYAQIEIGSAATGYEPYENLFTLRYYSNIRLMNSGRNMINGYNGTSTLHGVTFTNNGDGTFSTSGTATTGYSKAIAYSSWNNNLPGGMTYILSGCPSGGSENTYSMYVSYDDGSKKAYDYGDGVEFTTSIGHGNNSPGIYINYKKDTNMDGLTFKPMIVLKSIADKSFVMGGSNSHERYNINPADISDTLQFMGGSILPLTGKVNVDVNTAHIISADSKHSSHDYEFLYSGLQNIISPPDSNDVIPDSFICDSIRYNIPVSQITTATEPCIAVDTDGVIHIYLGSLGINTLEEASAWLTEVDMMIFYPLRDITTYDIDPIPLKPRDGYNIVFSSSFPFESTVRLSYEADTQKYIESEIETAIANISEV